MIICNNIRDKIAFRTQNIMETVSMKPNANDEVIQNYQIKLYNFIATILNSNRKTRQKKNTWIFDVVVVVIFPSSSITNVHICRVCAVFNFSGKKIYIYLYTVHSHCSCTLYSEYIQCPIFYLTQYKDMRYAVRDMAQAYQTTELNLC